MAYNHTCEICGNPYLAKFPHQKRCSPECRATAAINYSRNRDQSLTVDEWKSKKRHCKWCGIEFTLLDKSANHKEYCSGDCKKAGYSQKVKDFHVRNPGKQSEYNKTRVEKHGRDTLLTRLYLRHPNLPKSCESCGESRVIDLVHKPKSARNGAHRTLRQYQRHMFWILCPTCHALIDRGVCAPKELGLQE